MLKVKHERECDPRDGVAARRGHAHVDRAVVGVDADLARGADHASVPRPVASLERRRGRGSKSRPLAVTGSKAVVDALKGFTDSADQDTLKQMMQDAGLEIDADLPLACVDRRLFDPARQLAGLADLTPAARQRFDPAGHYHRPDVLKLQIG